MCLEGGWIGRRVEGRWRGIEEEMEVMDRVVVDGGWENRWRWY